MVFLIHTELRCTVNHTSDLQLTCFQYPLQSLVTEIKCCDNPLLNLTVRWRHTAGTYRPTSYILYGYGDFLVTLQIWSEHLLYTTNLLSVIYITHAWNYGKYTNGISTLHLKCDGTRTETRFRLSVKRMSPLNQRRDIGLVGYWQPKCAASAVVKLDKPCSEVVWRVLATHSIRQFPLHFPSRAPPCAITFQRMSPFKSASGRQFSRLLAAQGVQHQR